jgi:hypothetical protein
MSIPEIFCRGVISELVKVVVNTITKPFGEEGGSSSSSSSSNGSGDKSSSISNKNDTLLPPASRKQIEDYLNTSGYILDLFPEKFNKATRPMELNLLHLAVKYTPTETSNRVIKMILRFDPRMACYIDENYQTPLHLAHPTPECLIFPRRLFETNPHLRHLHFQADIVVL